MGLPDGEESDEEVKKAVDQYYNQLELPANSSGEDEDPAADPDNAFLNSYMIQYKMESMRWVIVCLFSVFVVCVCMLTTVFF